MTTSQLRIGLEQSQRSHHDLNLTLSYQALTEIVVTNVAITAEFRGSERSLGGQVGDDVDLEADY